MPASSQSARPESLRTDTNNSQSFAPASVNEALIACMKFLGGSKQVAPILWPEKAPEAAQRLLLDCLNDDRAAHLTPEQFLHVLRMARARGCHAGMQFLAAALGYAEPVPLEPRDEADQLRRELLEMGRNLRAKLARREGLEAAPKLMRAAA